MQSLRSLLVDRLSNSESKQRVKLLVLALNWTTIVGNKLATLVTPYQYKVRKGKVSLIVVAKPGQETIASYYLTQVKERVVAYTGEKCSLEVILAATRKIS